MTPPSGRELFSQWHLYENTWYLWPAHGRPGDCLAPVHVTAVNVVTRCRRCVNCLARRARQWYARTLSEVQYTHILGGRTWFVTLTFNERFMLKARRVPGALYQSVQRWLKRIRKSYPRPVRYVVVLEKGTLSGRLHFHLILCGSCSLQQRTIRTKWSHGFSEAQLVRPSSERPVVNYVCGYIAKDAAMVRASNHWGEPPAEWFLHGKGAPAPKIKIPF